MRQIKHNLLENCSAFMKYVSSIKFYVTGFRANIRWKVKICILIERFYEKIETIQLYDISYHFDKVLDKEIQRYMPHQSNIHLK